MTVSVTWFRLNTSTAIGWIGMEFGAYIHDAQRTYFRLNWYPLKFHLVPPAGDN